MVKKLMITLMLLLLPILALADVQVIDDANLFSDAEIANMNLVIERIEKDHQVDMAVLSTYDVPKDYSESMYRVRDYADDYYDQGGFGMGEDFSGMLILLDMNNRVMWLSTGGVMIEYINDEREKVILDDAYTYLIGGEYGGAMVAALERISHYMDHGRAEGAFLYDDVTGERLSNVNNTLTNEEIAVAAGVSITLFVLLCGGGAFIW